MTVPSWEFDEYMSALETTLEERMEEVPEAYFSMRETDYGFGAGSDIQQNPWAMERQIYKELLDGLEDVEDKQELFQYAGEIVETPGPILPSPLSFIEKAMSGIVESERGRIVQEIFNEAKRELLEESFPSAGV